MNEELLKQYQEALEAYYNVALPQFYREYTAYYAKGEAEEGGSTNPPKPPPPPPPPGGGQ